MPTWLNRALRSAPRKRSLVKILVYGPQTRIGGVAAITLTILGIGSIDYGTGPWFTLMVFYVVPICQAAAWFGLPAAVGAALLSVIVRVVGDYLLGAPYAHHPSVYWNQLIIFSTYMLIAYMWRTLVTLQRDLEDRVRARTAALAAEISTREKLQQEIIELSERERRIIGNDLHDGLGQHLTAMAYAAQILSHQLANHPTANSAREIVRLAEDGILQSRQLARGLLLSAIEPENLTREMNEMAAATERQTGVRCHCEIGENIDVKDGQTASNLFRIAEEAMRNSIRHGRPTEVRLSLVEENEELILEVCDNGSGLEHDEEGAKPGVGLHVMSHRAKILGGELTVTSRRDGGTRILCRVPTAGPTLLPAHGG